MIARVLHNLSLALGYKEPKQPTYETFDQQTSTDRITDEVRNIISNTIGLDVQCRFNNADVAYKLVDINTLKLFIAKNNLARYEYVKNSRDCDDFSYMLQGDVTHYDSDLAFGIVWGVTPKGQGHAWNWMIGTDRKIWFCEPQTNYVFKPDKMWKITLLVM